MPCKYVYQQKSIYRSQLQFLHPSDHIFSLKTPVSTSGIPSTMLPQQAYQFDYYPASEYNHCYHLDHYPESDTSHLNLSDSESPSFQSLPSLSSVRSLNSHPYRPQASHICLATLTGHTSYISSLELSKRNLYSGSSDTEIRSWTRQTEGGHDENMICNNNVITSGEGAVKSLVVSADKLFTAHQDHKIRIWRINDQEFVDDDYRNKKHYTRLATLPTLGDRVTKLLSPKNHIQVRRHKKSTWVHHVDTVSALALSQDETLLYSVSWDRTLKVWCTASFKCLESVTNAHDDAINALALSENGDVYTGSADKKIKVWRTRPGERKHSLAETLERHKSGINALALSSDGSVLYSGACDRSIIVWERDNEGCMAVAGALRGHTRSILCLAAISELVVSGAADKTIRVWRALPGAYSCLAVLEGHTGPVKCLTAEIDKCHSTDEISYIVYSGSLDCDIKVWQVFVPPP